MFSTHLESRLTMPPADGSSPAPAGGEKADEAKGDVLLPLPLPLPLPPAAFRMPDRAAEEDEVDFEGSVTSRMSTIGHCDVPAKSLGIAWNTIKHEKNNKMRTTGQNTEFYLERHGAKTDRKVTYLRYTRSRWPT